MEPVRWCSYPSWSTDVTRTIVFPTCRPGLLPGTAGRNVVLSANPSGCPLQYLLIADTPYTTACTGQRRAFRTMRIVPGASAPSFRERRENNHNLHLRLCPSSSLLSQGGLRDRQVAPRLREDPRRTARP